MDRGAWRDTVHGVARVGHDLATKPPHTHTHTHSGILLSQIREWIMPPAATWTKLRTNLLCEVSQTQRDKYHVITYMLNLNNDTKELIHKTETDSQTQKTNVLLPTGKQSREGINQEFEISRYKLLYTK